MFPYIRFSCFSMTVFDCGTSGNFLIIDVRAQCPTEYSYSKRHTPMLGCLKISRTSNDVDVSEREIDFKSSTENECRFIIPRTHHYSK